MYISDNTIQEIKDRIDIVDVVQDFVPLKKTGSNFKAISPFTDEKTPSFYVSPAKQIFKDFSSGKGGDGISFVMEMEGIGYIDALKYLAKKYGIEVKEEEPTGEELQRQSDRESLLIVLNFANQYFINNLWESDEGRSIGLSYFKERGLSEETIKKFELGYSFEKWDGLITEAEEKGYQQEFLEKAGLILTKENKTYDRFRGRVVFPIHNLTGKAVAFGARIMKDEKNQPKYINSPETDVYHKSSILYGLFQSRQAIRQMDNCYLVEGYTDVISLHQAGVENVVSSSGTSLTIDQIRLIKRFTENITVLFDGDDAGIKASLRGIDMILESGLNVRALVFPDGEDPDSYSRRIGSAEFREYIQDNQRDFLAFKVEILNKGADRDPVKKAETIRELVNSISKIPDPIKRQVFLRETSMHLEIEEQILIDELNKIIIRERQLKRKQSSYQEAVTLPHTPKTVRGNFENVIQESITAQEKESVRLLINYGHNQLEEDHQIYEYMLDELFDVEFQTPIYKNILESFKSNLAKGHVVDANYFLIQGDQSIKAIVAEMVTERYEISKNWKERRIFVPKEAESPAKSVFENILRLKHRVIQKLIDDNLKELTDAKEDKEIENLQKVNIELNRSKMEIGKLLGMIYA
ncbi:DNA primase [Bacteroidota bacterium]